MARVKVPGGLAINTFFALAFGVVAWFTVEALFPAVQRTVRGPMV